MNIFTWIIGNKIKILLIAGLVLFLGLYLLINKSPTDFPIGQVITVYPGESLDEISENLKELNVVKYPLVFRSHVLLLGGEKKVMAGDYLLDKIESPADLASRMVNGNFNIETVKITIPEGWSVSQMADYFAEKLINFDKKGFIALAKKEEGYLFPDTYFISPATKPDKLVLMLKANFETKMEDIPEINKSKYSLKEIITMASILEAEARTTESRRMVAGILWKRISLGIPLQVDAAFSYINGKNTYELTLDDLQIDSPYNTYKYRGLPPTPINNPGVDSIKAALSPTSSQYLYFLSSRDGKMYYAKTFDEHKRNKELYLN